MGPIPCVQQELRGARIGFGSGYQVRSEEMNDKCGTARAKSKCRGRGERSWDGRKVQGRVLRQESTLWAEEGA